MASNIPKVDRMLGKFQRKNRFSAGLGAELPPAYRKFWKEWKVQQPAAVHYVQEPGKWKRHPLTGVTTPVQNVPIPLKYPKEVDQGIWGGENIVQGFQKRGMMRRRNPHFWTPVLRRSVVHSEVLDAYLSVIVTDRTVKLINDHYGFDHYLLKTPACDLQSLLALKLKRKILHALQDNCPAHSKNPEKQKDITDKYKSYLKSYTAEEIEWYGLSFPEALGKIKHILDEETMVKPLKHIYRAKLIEKLKAASINEALEGPKPQVSGSWLSKVNPFAKKET